MWGRSVISGAADMVLGEPIVGAGRRHLDGCSQIKNSRGLPNLAVHPNPLKRDRGAGMG